MKRRIIVISLIVVVGLVAFIVFKRPSATQVEEAAKPVAQVQVQKLQNQLITQTLTAYGVVEGSPKGARSFTLGYDAKVKSVEVSAGSHVAQGDVVLTVTPTSDAQLLFDTAKADSLLADKNYQAVKEKYRLHLANSQDMYLAEQASRDAKLKLVSYTKRGMGNDRIAITEEGVITKMDLQVGTTIPAGVVLFLYTAVSQLDAHVTIEVADTSLVKSGQVVHVSSVNRSQLDAIVGQVRAVASSVDSVSGAVDLRISLPVGCGLMPGEHVRAIVDVASKTALAAPRAAVLPDDDQQVLYTVKDGKAVKHSVQIGLDGDDLVELISKDVKADDLAVIVGNYELEDGMAVELPSDKKAEESKPVEPAKDKAEAKTP